MDAAREGDLRKMTEQIERHREGNRRMVPLLAYWVNDMLDYIASKFGEEEVFNIWMKWMGGGAEMFESLGPEGRLERMVARHNSLDRSLKVSRRRKTATPSPWTLAEAEEPCGAAASWNRAAGLPKSVTHGPGGRAGFPTTASTVSLEARRFPWR